MCLGKAYIEKGTVLNPVMEDVTSIAMEEGKLVLTSLFGEKETFSGVLKNIDFNNSKIIIEEVN